VTADSQLAVNVIGYLRDTLGLAEAAHLYIRALSAAGISVSTTTVSPDLPVDPNVGPTITRHGHHPYEERRASVEPAFNLACVNGDQLAALMRSRTEGILEGRRTIGQWAWETDVLPPTWNEGFGYVEEIWVYSTFVAENLGRLAPVPVVVVPQAIAVPDPSGVELELARDQRFTFLFMLDFFSTLRRKNPLGLVEAFKRAFAPDEGPRLLLKTINSEFRPEAREELRSKIGGRPDIELIDGFLEARQKTALLARADCYVSLHRSEGFGLTLGESMALGTPVIATGYSGNTDFTMPHNSYLVDWTSTRVGPGCEVYPAEGSWAEPDLDHAAELMRWVWKRPDEARAKADRARLDIQRLYAPEVVGRLARARLERLADRRMIASARPSASDVAVLSDLRLADVESELAFDPARGAQPMRRGPRGVLRCLVLRLMLPFTAHERDLDRAMAEALRALHAELARERALRAEDRARVERLEERLRELEASSRERGRER